MVTQPTTRPYTAADVALRSGLPVHDVIDVVCFLGMGEGSAGGEIYLNLLEMNEVCAYKRIGFGRRKPQDEGVYHG